MEISWKDKKETHVNSSQGPCEGKISPHTHVTEINAKGVNRVLLAYQQEERATRVRGLWEALTAEELLSCTLRSEKDFDR